MISPEVSFVGRGQARLQSAAHDVGALTMIFTFVSLAILFGVVSGLIFAERRATMGFADEGDRILQIIFFSIYMITVLHLSRQFGEVWALLIRSWPVVAIVGLAMISTLWSIDPSVTVRRAGALIGTTAFGLFLGHRFGLGGSLSLVRSVLATGAVLSLGAVLVVPELAIMQGWHEGAWRGVFSHKNELGQVMALGGGLLLAAAMRSGRYRRLQFVLALLCAALVIKAQSLGGLAALGAMLLVWMAVAVARARGTPVRLTLICGALGLVSLAAAYVSIVEFDIGLSQLGRDETLTGRADLWRIIWEHLQARFWLGYGYGAFWTSTAGPAMTVHLAIDWVPANSHNGWLDLWLDLGLVGVTIMAALFVATALRAFSRLRAEGHFPDCEPLLVMTFLFVTNLAETALLQQNLFSWAIFVALMVSMRRERRSPGETHGG